jgi:hypothetical protein
MDEKMTVVLQILRNNRNFLKRAVARKIDHVSSKDGMEY